MVKNNRFNRYLLSASIMLLIYSACSTYCNYAFHRENQHYKTILNYQLPVAMHKLDTSLRIQHINNIQIKTIYQTERVYEKDTVREKRPIEKTIDTAAKYSDYTNNIAAVKSQYADSLKRLKAQNNYLVTLLEKSRQETANLHIIVQDLDSTAYQKFAVTKKSEPNSVLISPARFKKNNKGLRGIFSPNKNYFLATKLDSAGAVNSGGSYYISQTDDERNQIEIQARSAFNFGSLRASMGLGVELKTGRVALNVAWLGNPEYLRTYFASSSITAGLRYGFYRRRFK